MPQTGYAIPRAALAQFSVQNEVVCSSPSPVGREKLPYITISGFYSIILINVYQEMARHDVPLYSGAPPGVGIHAPTTAAADF